MIKLKFFINSITLLQDGQAQVNGQFTSAANQVHSVSFGVTREEALTLKPGDPYTATIEADAKPKK